MKKIILFLSIPFMAFAQPNVGDFVKYNVRIEFAGNQADQGTLEMKIVDKNQEGLFHVLTTTIFDQGGTQVEDEWAGADRFMSKEDVEQYLQICTQIGGTIENIQVPAGSFESCHYASSNDQEDSEGWIARVPLVGAAKFNSYKKAEDTKAYLELVNSSQF